MCICLNIFKSLRICISVQISSIKVLKRKLWNAKLLEKTHIVGEDSYFSTYLWCCTQLQSILKSKFLSISKNTRRPKRKWIFLCKSWVLYKWNVFESDLFVYFLDCQQTLEKLDISVQKLGVIHKWNVFESDLFVYF